MCCIPLEILEKNMNPLELNLERFNPSEKRIRKYYIGHMEDLLLVVYPLKMQE